MPSTQNIPTDSDYQRHRERVEKQRDEARSCLERFVVAVEGEDELLSNSAAVWDTYEAARLLLGHPVISYPGGCEGTHFHLYEWKTGDACDVCDDNEVIE